MENKTTSEVTGANFNEFVKSNDICILKAQVGKSIGFGSLVKSQFDKDQPGKANYGWIDIKRVSYRSRAIQNFIKIDLPRIGLNTGNTIPPGYYLFKNGELKAYHPGTFDVGKLDPNVAGFAMLSGAIAGVIVGLVKKSASKGFDVFLEAMEMPVALKVSEFFKEILNAKTSSYSQKRQQVVYNEEISNAYRLLQVTSNATDVEITKAWKNLLSEHHPDRHPNDIAAKNKYCAELNNAYDLIRKHRASNN
jgi:hypothetical protein